MLPDVSSWRSGAHVWLDGKWRMERAQPPAQPQVEVLNIHRPRPLPAGCVRFVLTNPHPLSNPFSLRRASGAARDAAIDAFAFSWDHPGVPLAEVARRFGVALSPSAAPAHERWRALQHITEAARAGPVALFCVCAPRRCHCDVVAAHTRVCAAALRDQDPPSPQPARQLRRKRSRHGGSAGRGRGSGSPSL